MKYKMKRLGTLTNILNWTIRHCQDGSFRVPQPDAIAAILKTTKMFKYNLCTALYNTLKQLDHSLNSKRLRSRRTTKYRQLLGEI